MRILLDENIPAKLKLDFGADFEVKSVREMRWQGTKNGELLGLIAREHFDYFITLDANLRYQQNLSAYEFCIILLVARNNKHQTLQPFIPSIKDILRERKQSKFYEIKL